MENIEYCTCTLWDHNAIFISMAYRGNSWQLNESFLGGRDETKWTTFDFMRNYVLQIHLVQLFKYLAEIFYNLKIQEPRNVVIIRLPNSYILHCYGECGLYTLSIKGNDLKNSKGGKYWILDMYTLKPQCKIFKYGLEEELMATEWVLPGRNRWN